MPQAGDLQAAQLAANDVGINYIIPGISIAFHDDHAGGSTVSGTFDITLRMSVLFPNQVGGTDAVTVPSSTLSFSGANFTSDNPLVSKSGGLQLIDDAVNGVNVSPALSALGLGTQIDTINTELGQAAKAMTPLVQPDGSLCLFFCSSGSGGGGPDQVAHSLFNLSVTVDTGGLTLTFSRGAFPPAPVGCEYGANGGWPAVIYAECSTNQPGGINRLTLMQQFDGLWAGLPNSFTETNDWSNEAVMASSGTWGDFANPTGAPMMGGRQRNLDGAPTVELSVCGDNQWGRTCTAPTSVTPQTNGVTDDANYAHAQYLQPQTSGGAAGGGGAGSSSPATNPRVCRSGCHTM